MPKLGVNIDHVATLRQARREFDPDPVAGALVCVLAGADSIVAHLREDRRHINDEDIRRLKKTLKIRFNLEMSIQEEIVRVAARIKPEQATLVPEKREEVTTEGGLDVIRHSRRIKKVIQTLEARGIEVSLFIDPFKKQIAAAHSMGARVIEIHTGTYDLAKTKKAQLRELKKIDAMTQYGRKLGLTVNAGHGLKYHNTKPIARIDGMHELNIGHSIITRALFVGLAQAVREMKELVQ